MIFMLYYLNARDVGDIKFSAFFAFFFFLRGRGAVGVNIAKIRRGEKEMAKLIGPFK